MITIKVSYENKNCILGQKSDKIEITHIVNDLSYDRRAELDNILGEMIYALEVQTKMFKTSLLFEELKNDKPNAVLIYKDGIVKSGSKTLVKKEVSTDDKVGIVTISVKVGERRI